jgi:hypothetical protein
VTAEDECGSKRLRPEEVAAIVNALLVLTAPLLIATITRWNEPERAVAVAWVSGPAPHPLNAWLAGAATTMAPLAPFAMIAAWRTHVHSRRLRLGEGRAWRGIGEAMALGALVPLGLLLPLIATRGLAGLGYASAYGVIGAVVGLGHGLALAIVATVVIRASKRFG